MEDNVCGKVDCKVSSCSGIFIIGMVMLLAGVFATVYNRTYPVSCETTKESVRVLDAYHMPKELTEASNQAPSHYYVDLECGGELFTIEDYENFYKYKEHVGENVELYVKRTTFHLTAPETTFAFEE